MSGRKDRAPYDSVASFYDQHWGREFASFAIRAMETHLFPVLPAGGAVLDLCCGTGLVLAELERRGIPSFGVDESAGMLALARRNAPRSQLQRADMALFQWDVAFDAVVSFYNSLNHARSLDHLRAALAAVADHLTVGGFLLCDYVLPEAFATAWEWNEQIAGRPGALEYTFDRASRRAVCVVNQRDSICQICFEPGQIHSALRDTGFELSSEDPLPGAGPPGGRILLLARKRLRGPNVPAKNQ